VGVHRSGVFTIAAPGQLQSVSPGEGLLKMTFRGTTATRTMRVFTAGEPPLYVYAPNVASGSVTGIRHFLPWYPSGNIACAHTK